MYSDGIYVASVYSILRNLLVTRCFHENKQFFLPSSSQFFWRGEFSQASRANSHPRFFFPFQLLSTHHRSEKVYRGSLSRDQRNRKLIVTVSQVIVCCTSRLALARGNSTVLLFLCTGMETWAIKAQLAGNFPAIFWDDRRTKHNHSKHTMFLWIILVFSVFLSPSTLCTSSGEQLASSSPSFAGSQQLFKRRRLVSI